MIIIGHRGYPMKYPENTIASFLGALLYGADGIELDVWLSADGQVVVIHDPDTERVSNVKLVVKESSYSDLAKIDLGMGQHIPLLRDVLKAVPRRYIVAIEIKDIDVVEETVKIVNEMNWHDNIVYVSFLDKALEKIRELDPNAKIGYNIGSVEAAMNAFKLHEKLKLYSINPPIQGLQLLGFEKFREYLVNVRRVGAKTVLWTVDDPGLLKGLEELVDAVITNNVEALIKK
ncbi:glycerophosphodiester phosphodiesterase family protein [Staphylothermus hellenicus]|uniref:Glycerophosphoryl diester phosphodiesterase n=1 Tax=Staphylothermus hellenicus (strain DSM 12710 / JCM 10830 / BK20S6-10-b1 / P8) TaxID=591019 RepID=D7DBY6_STAHD|nr:glycerophosphodiester phosphodiesterase family protein [Staphylothermus hellenicus]ADI31683.1 glycerophosphoryl diester phosphodiesterase [Staphylothermus hellenicus DSM 12710]